MQDSLICHFFKELAVLMIESASSKKVGLYVSFSNSFLKTWIHHSLEVISQYKLMFVKWTFELKASCNTANTQEGPVWRGPSIKQKPGRN